MNQHTLKVYRDIITDEFSFRVESPIAKVKVTIEAAPEMLQALKNIVSSAPITGLPLALEKDIQAACDLITRLAEK